MPKRAAASSSGTPAPKQPRVDGPSPATAPAARPHGRVVLNVGGTRFESSRSTLERASSYFRSLLTRWDDASDEMLFVDCDANAFEILLSYMRIGVLTLPQADEALCIRVLMQAESLGLESLLEEVKIKAYVNMHPGSEDHPASVAAFDEEVGNLTDAVAMKVLPARYFAPVETPPPPPERVVKALMPATPGTKAVFTDGNYDRGRATEYSEALSVVNFALVEYRDGSQAVDAVVQRDLDVTRFQRRIDADSAHPHTRSHLHFASEYPRQGYPGRAVYRNWVLTPPDASAQMCPVAPGAVRGVWRKPAVTEADVDKRITVVGNNMIMVDGEARAVGWRGEAPWGGTGVNNSQIVSVASEWSEHCASITHGDDEVNMEIPYLTGNAHEHVADVAFALTEKKHGGNIDTKFYIPIAEEDEGCLETRLIDARQARFGANSDLQFYCFIGDSVRAPDELDG